MESSNDSANQEDLMLEEFLSSTDNSIKPVKIRFARIFVGEVEDTLMFINQDMPDYAGKHGNKGVPYAVSCYLTTAAGLHLTRTIDKKLAELKDDPYLPEVKSHFGNWLVISAGPLNIKIEGISLADVLDQNKNVSLTDKLQFFLNVYKIGKKEGDDIVDRSIEGNEAFKDYPDLASTFIDRAARTLAAADLLFVDSKQKDIAHIRSTSKLDQKIHDTGLKLFRDINELKKKFANAILDPDNPDHNQICQRIEEYLNVEPDLVFLVLQPLDINFLKNLYRKSYDFTQEETEVQFYNRFNDELEEFAEIISKSSGILTKRDEPLFVKNGEYGNVSNIDNQEFRDSISRLVQSQREKAFLIVDTDKIFAESGLEKPESVVIDLGDGSPFVFNIAFVYGQADGTPLTIVCEYDIRKDKNTFDWSFIESPDELNSLYKELRLVTLKSLQFLEEAATKAKPIPSITQQGSSAPRIKREKEIREQMPKLPWKQSKKMGANLSLLQGINISEDRRTKIVNRIVIVENPQEYLTGPISTVDLEKLKQGLEKFNEKGLGRFKMLVLPDEDGQPLYSLDIRGVEARGGIRVLLKEEGSEKGNRNFKIKSIGYRKDIYRKFGV